MFLISLIDTLITDYNGTGEKKNCEFSHNVQHVALSLIVLLLNFANSLNDIFFTRGKYKSASFKFGNPAEIQLYSDYFTA